jgi:peptidyl-prolyl cis-trans isomerase C
VAPTARHALLHFLAIGGLAALGASWLAPAPVPETMAIDAAPVEEALRAAGSSGRRAAAEASARLDALVDEEILYREALARGYDAGDPVVASRLAQNAQFLGLEAGRGAAVTVRTLGLARGDVVVRRRLIQRMRAELEAPVRAEAASEAELTAYHARHAARFETPRRVAFRHVCFARAEREASAAAARAALAAWQSAGTVPVGDSCLAPSRQPLQTEADLARYFGPEFGRALFEQPPGEWAGPLEAPAGFHLVRVAERRPAEVPPLREISARVRAALDDERADAAVRAFLEERRAAYEVLVAETPGRAGR